MQVGLGSKVGSIDNIHTQGFTQTTGSALDLAIEGNGMFLVTDGTMDYYTRAGNFYFDEYGNIVNANGYYLRGYESYQVQRVTIDDLVITNDPRNGGIIATSNGEDIEVNENNGEYTLSYENVDYTINLNADGTFQVTYGDDNSISSKLDYNIDETTVINLSLPIDLESFSISMDGKVNYVDEDGVPRVAGQVALANFSNPAGLEKIGNNLY